LNSSPRTRCSAVAAKRPAESSPLAFEVTTARRTRDDALGGLVPAEYPLALYGRDRAVPPANADVLALDASGRPALWRVGERAFGLSAHPGLKVAMVEDLAMEFEESAADLAAGLARLRACQRALEDALVPLMAGLTRACGWMDAPTGLGSIPIRRA
jgi:hypothetical protein